jgi:hypothetical protein
LKGVTKKSKKSQTQWTRVLDAVQEHFSSHVSLDGGITLHQLPYNLYALKVAAKHSWVLYKKRECERRKRIRIKLEKEKANAQSGKPVNVLLAMVDSCESCKRLYVTVNLFWGVTLCDSCYFNPAILNDIMKHRNESIEGRTSYTPENIVKEVIQYRKDFFRKENKNYFSPAALLPPPPPPPLPPPPPSSSSSSDCRKHFEKDEVAEAIVAGLDDPQEEEEEEEEEVIVSDSIFDGIDFEDVHLFPPSPSSSRYDDESTILFN